MEMASEEISSNISTISVRKDLNCDAKRKYRQKFRQSWCDDPKFAGWLTLSPNSTPLKNVAHCKICFFDITCGKSEISRHSKSRKHQNKLEEVGMHSISSIEESAVEKVIDDSPPDHKREKRKSESTNNKQEIAEGNDTRSPPRRRKRRRRKLSVEIASSDDDQPLDESMKTNNSLSTDQKQLRPMIIPTVCSESEQHIDTFQVKSKTKKKRNSKLYAQRFRLSWLDDSMFAHWLTLSSNSNSLTDLAYCKICKTDITCGKSEILRHCLSNRHKKNEAASQNCVNNSVIIKEDGSVCNSESPVKRWLECFRMDRKISSWLSQSPNASSTRDQAYCTLCNVDIYCSIKAIKKHATLDTHKEKEPDLTDDENVILDYDDEHAYTPDGSEKWQENWRLEPMFSDWLTLSSKSSSGKDMAFCSACNTDIICTISEIKRHSMSRGHKQRFGCNSGSNQVIATIKEEGQAIRNTLQELVTEFRVMGKELHTALSSLAQNMGDLASAVAQQHIPQPSFSILTPHGTEVYGNQ